MNYNGYPQNMNGMYNNYPYAQMPNQNMMKDKATDYDVILMMSEQGELIKKYNKKNKA